MGLALVPGHPDVDVVGRAERVRRVYEERRNWPGRDQVQRLVKPVMPWCGKAAVRRCGVKGFTLIELMIVMELIVVLASIGLAMHANSQIRAREAVLKEDLFRLRDAIDQY